jgi:hypothetical protein
VPKRAKSGLPRDNVDRSEGKGKIRKERAVRSHGTTTIVAPTRERIWVSGGARRPFQFPAAGSRSRRFCGLTSPLGKLDIARQDGKNGPVWPMENGEEEAA